MENREGDIPCAANAADEDGGSILCSSIEALNLTTALTTRRTFIVESTNSGVNGLEDYERIARSYELPAPTERDIAIKEMLNRNQSARLASAIRERNKLQKEGISSRENVRIQYLDPKLDAVTDGILLIKAFEFFMVYSLKSNYQGEVYYAALYESLKKYDEEWIRLFESDLDWSERATGILGTYSMTLRRRGDYDKTRELVDGWYLKALTIYGVHVKRVVCFPIDKALHVKCFEELTAKYLKVKYNLLMNQGETRCARGEDLRKLFNYEIEHCSYDEYDYLHLCEFLGMNPDSIYDKEAIKAFLMTVTDLDLLHVYHQSLTIAAVLNLPNPTNEVDKKYSLKLCGNCRSTEAHLLQFQSCGKCKKIRYCSRKCQVIHWKKEHQKQCKKST